MEGTKRYYVEITPGDEARMKLVYSTLANHYDQALDRRPFVLPKSGRAKMRIKNLITGEEQNIEIGWGCARPIPPKGDPGYSFVLPHLI